MCLQGNWTVLNTFKPDHTLVISLGWQQLWLSVSLCIEKKKASGDFPLQI